MNQLHNTIREIKIIAKLTSLTKEQQEHLRNRIQPALLQLNPEQQNVYQNIYNMTIGGNQLNSFNWTLFVNQLSFNKFDNILNELLMDDISIEIIKKLNDLYKIACQTDEKGTLICAGIHGILENFNSH